MPKFMPWIAAVARGAAEVVLAFPLLFVAAMFSVPHDRIVWWLACLMLCYFIGYVFARLLSVAPKSAGALFSAIVAAGMFLLLFGPGSAGAWIGAVCGFVLLLRGRRSVEGVWGDALPIQAMWIAVAIYVPAAVVFRINERLQPESGVLLWMGLAALAVTIFAANEARLRRENKSGGRGAVSSSMRRANRLYTLLVLALIALVGSLGMIRSWLSHRLSALFQWFAGLFGSKAGKLDNELPLDGNGTFEMPKEGTSQGDPLWMSWLIKIVFVLAAIAFAAFLIYILYRGSRWLRSLLGKMMGWILKGGRGAWDGEDTGYEDVKENLFDWRDLRAGMQNRVRELLGRDGEPKWAQLADPRERIRWLYRKVVRRGVQEGYAFQPSLTPAETASDLAVWQRGRTPVPMDQLAGLYNRARYGTEDETFDGAELESLYQRSEPSQGGSHGRSRK